MSVVTVKTRLAEIQAKIAGVKRAYAQAPLSLPDSDLPAFVNFTGEATHESRIGGADVDAETRQYRMRLYIERSGQGIDGEAERLCEPFFDLVRDAFMARPGLEQLDNVQVARLLGDSGVSALTYAGEPYIGIEFRLYVMELVRVTYAEKD